MSKAILIPQLDKVSLEWWVFLVFGIALGIKMRRYVVTQLDPTNPLVGMDWGILLGAGWFYYKTLMASSKP